MYEQLADLDVRYFWCGKIQWKEGGGIVA